MLHIRIPLSSSSVFFLQAVLFALDPADGISWLEVPGEQTNAKNGSDFILRWHYKMDKNETFLSSEIDFFAGFQPYPLKMATRYKGENTYYKHKIKGFSFAIFGKNNLTLTIHSAEIGYNVKYCCVVVQMSASTRSLERRCSKVFVYAVPQISYHIPQLSSKQGDSIKIQCNATGFPSPRVGWIHEDTSERIDNSSHILLNITGKRSGGRYCCVADNGFGKDTACTVVNVTEYEPDSTKLLVKQMNVNKIHIKCMADASPPSSYFIMTIDGKAYNSRDGVKTIQVIAPRKDRRDKIALSCIPRNKYGQGPIKKVVFPLYAPRFTTQIRTWYNMTVSSIIMKCNATGIPIPNMTWTSGDTGEIVSNGEYCKVPYVKCAAKTRTYFCHARNAMGNITSPEIHVNMTTNHNCSTADNDLDQTTPNFNKKLIATVICLIIFIAVSFSFIAIIRFKREMASTKKDADATPTFRIYEDLDIYEEPIDTVVLERQESQAIATGTSFTDDGYATVKECVIKPRRAFGAAITVENNDPYQEPIDAVVVEREQSQSLGRSTSSTDDDYATVKECGFSRPRHFLCDSITVTEK